MEVLSRSLTQPGGGTFVVLLLGALLMAGMLGVTMTRQRRFESRYRDLVAGVEGQSMEGVLLDHLAARERLEQEVVSLTRRVEDLERKGRKAKRHAGLIRYDAFDDVGGEQSFALAVYDDEGDGFVVSSLVGRVDCRVYAKPLVNGQSERALSQEERRAIQEAADGKKAAIVSH